jgi:hypothetical protein
MTLPAYKLKPNEIVAWAPQPGMQETALHKYREVKELFVGGSRGPGKTDALIGDYLQDVDKWGAAWRGFFCRRSYPELEEVMVRCQEIMGPWAKWTDKNKTWTFPNGAFLRLRFMEHDSDWMRYQGHQYPWQGWDELPQHPTDANYVKMQACSRSPYGAPSRVRSSGNPGCPGQLWVKQRFMPDGVKPGTVIKVRLPNGEITTRAFLPASVYDNKILLANDPGYLNWLQSLPPALRRAWLEGDWSTFIGQVFNWLPRYHVLHDAPWPPPPNAFIFTSFDWGHAAPFSYGWYWVDEFGTCYRAREWYGWNGKANEGCRLSNVEIAQGVRKREEDWGIWGKVSYRVGGRDCFNRTLNPKTGDLGPTYNEDFISVDPLLSMVRANDKDRKTGLAQCHERLRVAFDEQGKVVYGPMFQVYEECEQFLRTVPTLVSDPHDVEMVDDSQEDHIFEEWRNAMMSRPLPAYEYERPLTGPARIIEMVERGSWQEGNDLPWRGENVAEVAGYNPRSGGFFEEEEW